jgi:hypothetical protein
MNKPFKRVLYIPAAPYEAWCKHLFRAFATLNDDASPVRFHVYNEAWDGVNLEITSISQTDVDYWYEWVLDHMLKAESIMASLRDLAESHDPES